MQKASRFSQVSLLIGYIALVVGAIDPLEGSLVILFGGGLILLSTYLLHDQRSNLIYRFWVFILIITGVAALWVLSMLGGFGGDSDLSIWWGLIILPYPIGWFMSVWGPNTPRWALRLSLIVGLYFLMLPILLIMIKENIQIGELGLVEIVLPMIGILIIVGSIVRLRQSNVIAIK